MEWYEKLDNINKLAVSLDDAGEWDGNDGVKRLLYFYRNPSKYNDEWLHFNGGPKCERLVELGY